MPPPQQSPITGAPADVESLALRGGYVVESPLEGRYEISTTLFATFASEVPEPLRYRLLAAVRQASETGTPLTLTTTNVTEAAMSVPETDPHDLPDALLHLVGRRGLRAGESITLTPETDYPLIASDGAEGMEWAINECVGAGLIRPVLSRGVWVRDKSGSSAAITLTSDGWTRLKSLRTPSAEPAHEPASAPAPPTPNAAPMLPLFVSHSSRDAALAKLLVRLFHAALGLARGEVRFTGSPTHGLPGGAHTDTELQREVVEARAFVGLISGASLDSLYVAFELGARWGARKRLLPVFALGFDLATLRGPLAGINGFRTDDAGHLQRLVSDLGGALGRTVAPAHAYQDEIDAVLAFEPPAAKPSAWSRPSRAAPSTAPAADDLLADADAVARAHCKAAFPDDYATQAFCLRQQHEAIEALRTPATPDVPADIFAGIRRAAARDYPDDFETRVYVERQQVEAYRQLHS